ncbi:MAG TPA: ATP cone domain-containing protein [Planctomycetota bacterium]|nr:ATP cone domain-containing protein [Planctomycetota bacterium]
MKCPEAVRKHDGRIVAFDSAKLAGSVTRAAVESGMLLESARRIGHEMAMAVGEFQISEARPVPASADLRACMVRFLRQTGHDDIADAYAEHSRAASSLLWRIRVVEPGTPFTSSSGSPWDRRRMLESLRSSGIARDPAGEVAREVERRVVDLGQERISPALIHALALMVLTQRAMETKTYAARRISFSLAMHVPRYDPVIAEDLPLPTGGPALQSFWLQAVHSQDVVRAAHDNILSLEPYPSRPDMNTLGAAHSANGLPRSGWLAALNPLLPEMATALREWCRNPASPLWVRADFPERAAELAKFIALLSQSLAPDASSGASINVLLAQPPAMLAPVLASPAEAQKNQRLLSPAPPITINLAGLMVREALRDQTRATVRVAQTTAVAAQAHREREEYFSLSPVRGRPLPVCIAGLWNAAAWLQGENFESRHITRNSRSLAATLISVVRGAVETLRNETGMELLLAGHAPLQATRALWRRDREFFLRDGVNLDAQAMYDGGPAVKLLHGSDDFAERIDFAKAAGTSFDEPPALILDVPLGGESDATAWRELFSVFAQAGVPRLQLIPGGSVRSLKSLTRAVRSHLEGFPLFEQVADS